MQSIEDLITAAKERRALSEAEAIAEKERREQEEIGRQRALFVKFYGELVTALDMQFDSGSGGAMFEFHGRQYHLYEMHNGPWHLVRYADEDAYLSPSRDLYPIRTGLADNCDELLLALDTLSAQADVPFPSAEGEIPYSPRAITAREERLLEALQAFIQSEL